MYKDELPEMLALESIVNSNHPQLDAQKLCSVDASDRCFPVYAVTLGCKRRNVPAVGFFGGVHGLERIGTQVLLAFMKSLLARLRWDRTLQAQLASVRLLFMPIVNPAGMWHGTRCNARGVDLMRNAPVDATEKVPLLLGGQRFSARLPWFRGFAGQPMEVESEALCRIVTEELLSRRFSIALDCHSGFGLCDRIWFPFAHSSAPIRHLPEVFALQDLFNQAYPNHNYVFEPQSRQYLTHGDLWDYLYLQAMEREDKVFLPLTLEMGSWRWVKKNPLQLLSRIGLFNPLPVHRLRRVLRRHLVWLDFLALAAGAYRQWLPQGRLREEQQARAFEHWYKGAA
ncbi:MAG TPA: M14 family zinc carboxypeptidase [Noviherbaspirillum sp.]|nr:M14 family zinc carboxypeptidase [Noviherbaspirillum sp.]